MLYLYTGKIKNIDNDNAYDLLCFSRMSLLSGLKNQVVQFLKEYINQNQEDKEIILKLSDEFDFKL